MDNVVNLPPQQDLSDTLFGPTSRAAQLIFDGRAISKIEVREEGDSVVFLLDRRLSYSFPREFAYLAAAFASNAMAIGAGFPHAGANKKFEGFAPQCAVVVRENTDD